MKKRPRQPREINVYQIAVPAGHPIMPDRRPAPSVLTEEEAAEYLRVCPRTMAYYRKQRRVRGFKNGRIVLYRIEELERFTKTMQEEKPA